MTIQQAAYRIAMALLLVGLITLASFAMSRWLGALWHYSSLYLIAVIVAAIRWGIAAAIAAAVTGVMASAFFFYPPLFDLRVASQEQALDLSVFIFVAIVTGQLAATLKQQAVRARQREAEMRDLYAFSRRLATAFAAPDIHAAVEQHLAALIGHKVVLIDPLKLKHRTASEIGLPPTVLAAVRSAASGGPREDDGIAVPEDGRGTWLVRRISPRSPELGIVAVQFDSDAEPADTALRARINSVLADAAATLERLDIGSAIAEARLRSEAESLREALLGSVSHELRTPLASILGAATVLQSAPEVTASPRLKELAFLVRDEAERLNHDIQNFLDATRISSKGLQPNREWVDPADIANSALERCRRRLQQHRVSLRIDDDLPLIHVDPVLINQTLIQVIDNAAKYSPAGSAIDIAAHAAGGTLVFSVTDRGAGLTAEEKLRSSERFYRSARLAAAISGSGLGLWIASAFVTANGGRLDMVSPGPGRGSTVSMKFPISSGLTGGTAPAMSEVDA